jgi:hypothetical protein
MYKTSILNEKKRINLSVVRCSLSVDLCYRDKKSIGRRFSQVNADFV